MLGNQLLTRTLILFRYEQQRPDRTCILKANSETKHFLNRSTTNNWSTDYIGARIIVTMYTGKYLSNMNEFVDWL